MSHLRGDPLLHEKIEEKLLELGHEDGESMTMMGEFISSLLQENKDKEEVSRELNEVLDAEFPKAMLMDWLFIKKKPISKIEWEKPKRVDYEPPRVSKKFGGVEDDRKQDNVQSNGRTQGGNNRDHDDREPKRQKQFRNDYNDDGEGNDIGYTNNYNKRSYREDVGEYNGRGYEGDNFDNDGVKRFRPNTARPTAWYCPKCDANNFPHRRDCYKCGLAKPPSSFVGAAGHNNNNNNMPMQHPRHNRPISTTGFGRPPPHANPYFSHNNMPPHQNPGFQKQDGENGTDQGYQQQQEQQPHMEGGFRPQQQMESGFRPQNRGYTPNRPGPVLCKYGGNCTNPHCTFAHPSPAVVAAQAASQRIQCRFYPNCLNPACKFYPCVENKGVQHTATTAPPAGSMSLNNTVSTVPCRFDGMCTRPNCPFLHKLQQKHTSERVFVKEGDDQVEKINGDTETGNVAAVVGEEGNDANQGDKEQQDGGTSQKESNVVEPQQNAE